MFAEAVELLADEINHAAVPSLEALLDPEAVGSDEATSSPPDPGGDGDRGVGHRSVPGDEGDTVGRSSAPRDGPPPG